VIILKNNFLNFVTSILDLGCNNPLPKCENALRNLSKNEDAIEFTCNEKSSINHFYSFVKNGLRIFVTVNPSFVLTQIGYNRKLIISSRFDRRENDFDKTHFDYQRMQRDAGIPITSLLHNVSYNDWDNNHVIKLCDGNTPLLTNNTTTSNSTNEPHEIELSDGQIAGSVLDLRTRINHLLRKDIEYLSIEEKHTLERYRSNHLKKTFTVFEKLDEDTKEKHRLDFQSRIKKIEKNVLEIENKMRNLKENELIRQFHIIDQNS
jgi:hypothetical protein